jgi:hypothetical protein
MADSTLVPAATPTIMPAVAEIAYDRWGLWEVHQVVTHPGTPQQSARMVIDYRKCRQVGDAPIEYSPIAEDVVRLTITDVFALIGADNAAGQAVAQLLPPYIAGVMTVGALAGVITMPGIAVDAAVRLALGLEAQP